MNEKNQSVAVKAAGENPACFFSTFALLSVYFLLLEYIRLGVSA